MQFGPWDTLLHILVFFFWFRIWTGDDRNLFFNPYLAPLDRLSRSIITFLRPAAFGLPARFIPVIGLIALLILRGAAVPQSAPGMLRFGFAFFTPDADRFISCLALGILSFCVFLFKIWSFCLIYVRTKTSSSDHAADALYYLSRPFSDLDIRLRPLILIVCGTALAYLLNLAGVSTNERALANTTILVLLLKHGILALAAFADVLRLIQSFIMLLIIGSWVSMFSAAHGLMAFCAEWMDMLLGPVRRFPLRIGMFDLTPLIFWFVLGYAWRILLRILLESYLKLP